MATSRQNAGLLRLKDQEAEELQGRPRLIRAKAGYPEKPSGGERIYRLEGADLRYIRLESF